MVEGEQRGIVMVRGYTTLPSKLTVYRLLTAPCPLVPAPVS